MARGSRSASHETGLLADLRWWLKDGTELANTVMARARDIAMRQSFRRQEDEHHLRLYSVSEWRGAFGFQRTATTPSQARTGRLALNVVRNCINAGTNMICRSKPQVIFQTNDADFGSMLLAKRRQRFTQALFQESAVHQLSQRRVKNGLIFGLGGTKVVRNGSRIEVEDILPGEIVADDQESMGGDPPCIYQVKRVDKLALAAKYPEHADKIAVASGYADPRASGSSTQALVVFGWHFPAEKDKSDGWEVLCIDGAVLYRRPYRWHGFPGTFFRWEEDPFGFYGTGVAAELTGIQYEINALLRTIQDSCYFGGNLKVFVEKGSKVQQAQITNSTRVPIIEYVGRPPTFAANDIATPQLFEHLQYLEQRAYNVTGISQLDAQSQTPFASMSGRARLVHQNAESLRFKATVDRYEQSYCELAQRMLEAATDLADGYGGEEDPQDETIICKGTSRLDELAYSDVALRDGETSLDVQAWSASGLALTPGARIEQADFLVTNGYVPKERGLVMMDLGNDVAAEVTAATAPYEAVDAMLERMIEDGVQQWPKPYTNLAYALERSQIAIQRCEFMGGIPAAHVDMLRAFREEVLALQKDAAMAQAPAPTEAPTAAAPGQPMPIQEGGAPPVPPPPIQEAAPMPLAAG